MYVGTTPQIKINLNIPIDHIKRLWITFESQKVELTKEISDCDIIDNQIYCTLSQEDTFLLNPDNKDIKIKLQVRILTDDDKAFASNITELQLKKILKEGIIDA